LAVQAPQPNIAVPWPNPASRPCEDQTLEGRVSAKGAAGFLHKPIEAEQLHAAIAAALRPLAS